MFSFPFLSLFLSHLFSLLHFFSPNSLYPLLTLFSSIPLLSLLFPSSICLLTVLPFCLSTTLALFTSTPLLSLLSAAFELSLFSSTSLTPVPSFLLPQTLHSDYYCFFILSLPLFSSIFHSPFVSFPTVSPFPSFIPFSPRFFRGPLPHNFENLFSLSIS